MSQPQPTTERQPVFVHCGQCGEEWKVATVPMNFNDFCRHLNGHVQAGCPNCGERKKIYMGKKEPAVE